MTNDAPRPKRRLPFSDRLPPHSIEAEQGILGCCILDPSQTGFLLTEWFYDLRHQKLAETLLGMVEDALHIDLVTLQQRLKDDGNLDAVGGIGYVSSLADCTPSASNFAYYRPILEDKLMLRRLIRHATEHAAKAFEEANAGAVLDSYESGALAVRLNVIEERSIRAICHNVQTELDECAVNRGQILGIPTGFVDLDEIIYGFRPGQYIVIAARPSVGKSSLVMNFAEYVAVDRGMPVGVLSLEMTSEELVKRMACTRARQSLSAALRGTLEDWQRDKVGYALSNIVAAPLHIDDTSDVTIGKIRAMARKMYQAHGIKLLIIDYLQLIRGEDRSGENRNVEMTRISNGIKSMAKELKIPVIVCSQLNRDSEKDNRSPRLSDLRDSGAIEQDADIIGLLHRKKNEDHAYADPCEVTLIIAKQRNGPTGAVNLVFFKSQTRFECAAKISENDVPPQQESWAAPGDE